jgi:hypothetical protein
MVAFFDWELTVAMPSTTVRSPAAYFDANVYRRTFVTTTHDAVRRFRHVTASTQAVTNSIADRHAVRTINWKDLSEIRPL